MKKILALSLFTILSFFTIASFADEESGLYVEVHNDSIAHHRLKCFFTQIPEGDDIHVYADVEAEIGPDTTKYMEILRKNLNPLSVHLKVIDIDAENRIVWEGEVSNQTKLGSTSISSLNPSYEDKTNYNISYDHDDKMYRVYLIIK